MPFILFDFVRFGPPLPKRLRGPVFSNLATLQLSSAPSPLHRVFQLTRRALFSRSSTFLGRAAYILHATFFSRKTGTFFFFQDLNRETRVKIAVFNCDEHVAESPGKINTALDWSLSKAVELRSSVLVQVNVNSRVKSYSNRENQWTTSGISCFIAVLCVEFPSWINWREITPINKPCCLRVTDGFVLRLRIIAIIRRERPTPFHSEGKNNLETWSNCQPVHLAINWTMLHFN